jgi:hypothetical protein
VNHHAKHRDDGEKHNKNYGDVKNEFFNAASRFKDRTRACTSKCTAQARAAGLQQDKDNAGDSQNDLYYANGWNPLSQDIFLTFVFDLSVS